MTAPKLLAVKTDGKPPTVRRLSKGFYDLVQGRNPISGTRCCSMKDALALRDELVAEGNPALRRRACLRCRDPFASEGPHHRMCSRCRSQSSKPTLAMIGGPSRMPQKVRS